MNQKKSAFIKKTWCHPEFSSGSLFKKSLFRSPFGKGSGTLNGGFTLIELLVVIVIIGILATISVAQYNNYQDRAREAVAQAALSQLEKALVQARITSQKYLKDITGSNCSYCIDACANNDLRNVPDTNACFVRWKNFLDTFSAESGIDLSGFYRDPWGSPYLLDENEHEYSANPCRKDWIRSAGPDGVLHLSANDRGYDGSHNNDNYHLTIPFFDAKCNQ